MKYLFSIILISFISGCATSGKKWDVYSDEIATDMAPLNVRLRGTLVRKEKIKDFSVISSEEYLSYASKNIDSSEQSYMNFILKKDTFLEFVGEGRDFVVCAKNSNLILVLCDKASTGLVDFVSKDVSVDLKVKAESFFLLNAISPVSP